MIICLDFDGVLHDPTHRAPGYRMGVPVLGAKLAVKMLLAAGNTVWVHTARATQEQHVAHIVSWLKYFDFPELPVSITKPRADVYVDDKAVRFSDWDHTLTALAFLRAGGVPSEDGRTHTQEQIVEHHVTRVRDAQRRYGSPCPPDCTGDSRHH